MPIRRASWMRYTRKIWPILPMKYAAWGMGVPSRRFQRPSRSWGMPMARFWKLV